MEEQEAIYRQILPYLIGIYITTDTYGATGHWANEKRRFVLSASVFEYGGKWVIATAGHIVERLNAIVQSGGQLTVKLIDGWSADSSNVGSIPLAYDPEWTWSHDDGKLDYGFILLPDNTRSLLEANGLKPIGHEHHSFEPTDDKFEQCAVLGIPSSSQNAQARSDEVTIGVTPSLVRLEHDFEVPDEVKKPNAPLWYGRLLRATVAEFGGMDGMSGGIVFGFRRKNSRKIWLQSIGLQYAVKNHDQYTYVMVTPWYVVNLVLDEYRKRIQADLQDHSNE